MNKIIIIFAFVVFFLTPINSVLAQNKTQPIIRISPLIFNISLSPGKTYSYKLRVENLTDSPLPVKTYLENFTTTDEEGGYTFKNNISNPLISWSKVFPEDLIIPAKTSRQVNLTVKIPNKVPFGGYYNILFIEPVISKQETPSLVSSKIGALVLANIGVDAKNSKGEILNFSIPKLINGNNLNFLLRVKNNGLNHFSAKPRLFIKPVLGKEQEIQIEEKFIFPGKTRRWDQKVSIDNKWRGIYTTKLTVSIGNGNQLSQKSYFISLPFEKIFSALLLGTGTWFIIFRRKRIIKAIKILIKNNK